MVNNVVYKLDTATSSDTDIQETDMSFNELKKGRLGRLKFDEIVLDAQFDDREKENRQNGVLNIIESIAEIGITDPVKVLIRVKEDGTEEAVLTHGYTRHEAVRQLIEQGKLDKETFVFPAIPETKGQAEVDLVATQLISNSGQALTQYEQGKVYKKMMELAGLNASQVAAHPKVKKTPTHVENCLKLLELSPFVQEVLAEGIKVPAMVAANGNGNGYHEPVTELIPVQVSETFVLETVKEVGEEKALEILQEAAAEAVAQESQKNGKKRDKIKATSKHAKAAKAKKEPKVKENRTVTYAIDMLFSLLTENKVVKYAGDDGETLWTINDISPDLIQKLADYAGLKAADFE